MISLRRLPATCSLRAPAAEMHRMLTSRYPPMRTRDQPPSLASVRTTGVVQCLLFTQSIIQPSQQSFNGPLISSSFRGCLWSRWKIQTTDEQIEKTSFEPCCHCSSLHRCRRCPCLVHVSRSLRRARNTPADLLLSGARAHPASTIVQPNCLEEPISSPTGDLRCVSTNATIEKFRVAPRISSNLNSEQHQVVTTGRRRNSPLLAELKFH